MFGPFSYFDKIFVISDPDNRERRSYIKKVLHNLDVEFEFFDAIMGKELSKEEIKCVYDEEEAIKHKTNRRALSKAEVGCALSHIAIYKQIIAEDWDNALIFEDDIVPNYHKMKWVKSAIKELPEDWDVFHLGVLDHYKKAPLSFKLKLLFYYPFITFFYPQKIDYTYTQLWNLHARNYSDNLNRAGYHLGCQSYAMSNSGAKKFLDYHDKIVTPVDMMLSVMFVEDKLNGFVTKELIFDQNQDLESSIELSRKKIKYGKSIM